MDSYAQIADVRAEIAVPQDGILSRTVHKDHGVTLTVFGFDAGQELTEHTASRAAVIEILEGEADVTLGDDSHRVGPGAWIAMPPGLRHAIRAVTPLKMSLILM